MGKIWAGIDANAIKKLSTFPVNSLYREVNLWTHAIVNTMLKNSKDIKGFLTKRYST